MRLLLRFAPLAVFGIAASIVLPGLSRFGIWDPWELEAADSARRLLEGHGDTDVHAGPFVASLGFRLLGVDEWSGRLPIALCGLLAVVACYALAAQIADRRAALYAAIIAASSPLFVLNARLMLGEAPSFALQGAIALAGLIAVSERTKPGLRIAALAATLASAWLAVLARGALLGALPPLLAVALASWVAAPFQRQVTRERWIGLGVVTLASLALLAVTVHAMWIDPGAHNVWLGGSAQGGQPPSFDAVLERVLHSFAPWSALLPLALARLAWATPIQSTSQVAPEDEAHAANTSAALIDARIGTTSLMLWIALGYAAQTLFLSRYGHEAAFLPIVALACAVAIFLRDFERFPNGHWPIAAAIVLLSLLLVRDYNLFPIAPVHGLALSDFKAPEGFNPRAAWSAALGLFGVVALLGLGAPRSERLALRAPYAYIRQSWRRGLGYKAWWLVAALVLLALLAYGAIAFIQPSGLKLTTLARKWGQALGFVPFLIPIGIAGFQLALFAAGRLGNARPWIVLLAGACVGLYTAHGFMPKLSAHFSPRDVYETYNLLAKPKEPLVEYRVGGRAAAYYAQGPVQEVDSLNALVRKLTEPTRIWAALPADELAAIDRLFRRKAKRHLFGADMRSGRVILVSNQPIEGRKDENPLTGTVRSDTPKPQHVVHANWDGKIELLGYDLSLPHDNYVGAGERFEITWYFRTLRTVPGDYKLFVHIDGDAQRIHGDHQAINGTYPLRYWDEGDVIVDRHRLDVPSTFRPATFEIFLGFFAGETRLPVTEGPKDDANRVRAGVLRIR